jgi:transcription termination factor Rho
MTEINDANPTLDNGSTEAQDLSAQAASPAPKAKRNSRRTPRRTIDDSSVLYVTPPAPKRTRAPRARRQDAVAQGDELPSQILEAPAAEEPRSSRADDFAPSRRDSGGLSDEIALPSHSISVPRREEDVPVRYSTDDDDVPAERPASASSATSTQYPEPGSKAAERRRDRRNARLSREEEDADDRYETQRELPLQEASNEEPSYRENRYDDRDDADSYGDDRGDRESEGSDSTPRDSDSEENNAPKAHDYSDESDADDDEDDDSDSTDTEDSAGRPRDNQRDGQDRDRNRDQRRDDKFRHGNNNAYNNQNQQGAYDNRHLSKRQKFKLKKQQQRQQGNQNQPRPQPQGGHGWNDHQRSQPQPRRGRNEFFGREDNSFIEIGDLPELEVLRDSETMEKLASEHQGGGDAIDLIQLLTSNLHELMTRAREEFKVPTEGMPIRAQIIEKVLNAAWEGNRAIMVEGVVETAQDGWGLLTYQHDNYRVRPLCSFIPRVTMKRYGLKRGHIVKAFIQPPRKELTIDGNKENCPAVLKVTEIMGKDPILNLQTVPFEDLTPYYPTERFLLETSPDVKWDNVSMRVVDLLTPVGKGQRGLIVAPPRTGKTILQQGIANAIMRNNPESHLIVLLVDERPEEVTDFRRQIASNGEVIASTFDENAESHVHAAEMVIEKSRRMVEAGKHVVILLDSITRLARAYNTLAANSGKILSGGVEATAMQKPKRFFGSARNIEGGGSLTILGTALVETGSRMDEVIFEEFKGTGNMELVLDRALVDKRIFPSINLEKSGTRKEELLYHPDELIKVYGLRRAMKGVPSPDAMEMLIGRVKKTKTNIEFLMGLNR